MSQDKTPSRQNVTGQNATQTKCHRTKWHRTKCHRTKCYSDKMSQDKISQDKMSQDKIGTAKLAYHKMSHDPDKICQYKFHTCHIMKRHLPKGHVNLDKMSLKRMLSAKVRRTKFLAAKVFGANSKFHKNFSAPKIFVRLIFYDFDISDSHSPPPLSWRTKREVLSIREPCLTYPEYCTKIGGTCPNRFSGLECVGSTSGLVSGHISDTWVWCNVDKIKI